MNKNWSETVEHLNGHFLRHLVYLLHISKVAILFAFLDAFLLNVNEILQNMYVVCEKNYLVFCVARTSFNNLKQFVTCDGDNT